MASHIAIDSGTAIVSGTSASSLSQSGPDAGDPFPQPTPSLLKDVSVEKPLRQKRIVAPYLSLRSELFRRRWFPESSIAEWNDWSWQLHHRFTRFEQIKSVLRLSADEKKALSDQKHALPFAITPYFASLLDEKDCLHPLRRTMIPVIAERTMALGESVDPLAEGHMCPVDGLIHRYPDRVLFLATSFCSSYCRYCTRSRLVGNEAGRQMLNRQSWEKAIEYIKAHKEIRDVLISGGDPLTMPDEAIEWILKHLRAIKHVEILRIGTKVPVVLPQRITQSLVRILKKYHPLFLSIHVTHPDEITTEMRKATETLADAGIPLGSQTVLLQGINDDTAVLKTMYHQLLSIRVKPYYLYQCDPIAGSSHFRTSVDKGVEILRGLRGHTSGYAIPYFVIDAPGGGGKIPINPDYTVGRQDGKLCLTNYEGKTYYYPDYVVESQGP